MLTNVEQSINFPKSLSIPRVALYNGRNHSLPHIPMSQPQFRRRYEMLSYLLSVAVPLGLILIDSVQEYEIKRQARNIEDLRAELATIRLNSSPTATSNATTTPQPKPDTKPNTSSTTAAASN